MTPCGWAACDKPAYKHEDGWWHCKSHLRDHREMFAVTTTSPQRHDVGSISEYRKHYQRGEQPCLACRVANSDHNARRRAKKKAA